MKHKNKERPKDEKQADLEKDELEELRAQMESLQAEKDEILGKLQRVSADYANFQKRVPKQIADTISYEKEKIIKTLLPALDNFDHTLQKAPAAENVEVLVKGIRIIYDQMLDILKSHGAEQIKAIGEKFDPALHEAMMQQAEDGTEDNVVLEEFQKGYKLNGRVIRPAKVVVNKLPSEAAAPQEQVLQEDNAAPREEAINERETTDME